MPYQLHVAKQFLEGYLPGREDVGGCFDDLAKGGYFFVEDAPEGLLFLLVDGAFVVGIDLLSPKLLEAELFLDLAFEDAELRGEAEGGEDGLPLLEGDGLGRSFEWFG